MLIDKQTNIRYQDSAENNYTEPELHPFPDDVTWFSVSLEERTKVAAPHDARISLCGIVNQLGRSCCVVRSYLADPAQHATKQRQNRPKMTTKYERRLFWSASNSTKSAQILQSELKLPIPASKTRAYPSGHAQLRYTREIAQLPLIRKKRRQNRVKWVWKYVIIDNQFWGCVVFSNEKDVLAIKWTSNRAIGMTYKMMNSAYSNYYVEEIAWGFEPPIVLTKN